jgi:dTDP-4-dehydrorhamnose 3,5-epimerase
MIFESLELNGAWLIKPQPIHDTRGYFTRTFCEFEFGQRGLETRFVQCSSSYTREMGTIRGLHYQSSPNLEAKVVRCVRGAIYDVVLDLRGGSETFGRWTTVELSEESGTQLYIPCGFAHGFQTIRPDCELHYMISTPYVAEKAAGIRYDDAVLAITWPLAVTNISDRDRGLPSFDGSPID